MLVLAVKNDEPWRAYAVVGTGEWADSALLVAYDSVRPPLAVPPGEPVPIRTLARAIVPQHRARVLALAKGADAGIALWVSTPPAGGVTFDHLFYGLVRDTTRHAIPIIGEP